MRVVSSACARTSVCLAALAGIPVLTVLSPSPAMAQQAPQAGKVVIPERTEIKMVLDQDLKSGNAKEGAEVLFHVDGDVVATDGTGTVLIKGGTPAYGKVLISKKRGMLGKPGKLDFSCDYVLLPDKTHLPLRATPLARYGKDNRTGSVATAVLLAPVALFVSGRDVTVKQGEKYTFYADREVVSYNNPADAAAAAGKSAPGGAAGIQRVFLVNNGTAVIGSLTGYNGTDYTVASSSGPTTVKAADVKSIVMDKSGAGTAEKNLFMMKNGDAVVGVLLGFDGNNYSVVNDSGTKTIKASDVQSIGGIK